MQLIFCPLPCNLGGVVVGAGGGGDRGPSSLYNGGGAERDSSSGGGGVSSGVPAYLSGRDSLARESLCSSRTTKSASKQSLLDIVGNRLGVAGGLSLGVSINYKYKFSYKGYLVMN